MFSFDVFDIFVSDLVILSSNRSKLIFLEIFNFLEEWVGVFCLDYFDIKFKKIKYVRNQPNNIIGIFIQYAKINKIIINERIYIIL